MLPYYFFRCLECGRESLNFDFVKFHVENDHADSVDSSKVLLSIQDILICEFCRIKFFSLHSYNIHILDCVESFIFHTRRSQYIE